VGIVVSRRTGGGGEAVEWSWPGWGRFRPSARFRGAAEEFGEPLQVLRPTSCFCSPPQSSDSAVCWLPLCRITALWGDLRRFVPQVASTNTAARCDFGRNE